MPPTPHDEPTRNEPERRPFGWAAGDSAPEAPLAEPEPDTVFCRRCGETSVPTENCCPWCGAWVVGEPPRVAKVYKEEEDDDLAEEEWRGEWKRERPRESFDGYPINPVVVVALSYVILLGSLIGFAVIAAVGGATRMEDMYGGMAVVQVLDGLLTLGAMALVWRAMRQERPVGTLAVTWAVAFPVLALLLSMNIAFITIMRELLKPLGAAEQPRMEFNLAAVFVICVLPGIMEELFFRQMALGVFRKVMNLHAAVWVTAVMFGGIHVGQLLGIPYLILAGAVFGYARVYGGLPLAMLMHFIHNLVVIAYDAWR